MVNILESPSQKEVVLRDPRSLLLRRLTFAQSGHYMARRGAISAQESNRPTTIPTSSWVKGVLSRKIDRSLIHRREDYYRVLDFVELDPHTPPPGRPSGTPSAPSLATAVSSLPNYDRVVGVDTPPSRTRSTVDDMYNQYTFLNIYIS